MEIKKKRRFWPTNKYNSIIFSGIRSHLEIVSSSVPDPRGIFQAAYIFVSKISFFYKLNYSLKKYFSHNHVIWDSFTLHVKTVNVVLDVCLIENLIHVISKLIKGVRFSSHLTYIFVKGRNNDLA